MAGPDEGVMTTRADFVLSDDASHLTLFLRGKPVDMFEMGKEYDVEIQTAWDVAP